MNTTYAQAEIKTASPTEVPVRGHHPTPAALHPLTPSPLLPTPTPVADRGAEAEDRAANKQLVEALANSTLFGEYQRAFGLATGLPLTLRPVEGWQLAGAGNRHQNGFCALMAENSRTCAACLQAQQRVCEGANGVPSTAACSHGLTESAVKVKIGEQTIGFLQTGQVFFRKPTATQTDRVVKQISESGASVDLQRAASLYRETPVVPRDQYLAKVELLRFFADQLGAMANQISLQQKTSEPAAITRAKQFIEEHHEEQLSLGQVAQHVHMSSYYFCKMFHRTTGLRFTDYVARLRIEKARNLLLNLHYRISEIAYQVGFQSLTHFNRTFKRIAGQSPTEFREKAGLA